MNKLYLLLLALFSFNAQAELLYGQFSNLQSSPITGDIGGYQLSLKKDNNKISGTMNIAAGDFIGAKPLQKLKCEEQQARCRFVFKEFDRMVPAELTRIGTGYIMRYKDAENAHKQTFLSAHDQQQVSEKDVLIFAKGNFYADTQKKQLLRSLPDDTAVIFEEVVETDNNFLMKISVDNTQGYVEPENFYHSSLAIVSEDNTPFRLQPNTNADISQTLTRTTLLSVIKVVNKHWLKVSYQGKIGFVPRSAIVAQVDLDLLEQLPD